MKDADILILGAGCAGTSLAHYLEDFGYQGKIVLLDSRTKFNREQRWCGWAKLPASLAPLAVKSWNGWTVSDEHRSIARTSENFPYRQIYAPDFFAHFHGKWQRADSPVELNLGERVETLESRNERVEVTTNRTKWRANLVFDARHLGSANLDNVQETAAASLQQTFLGWKIKFSRPVFAPRTVTLMDFRTAQTDCLNFIYVLPYTDREALIESTAFCRYPAASADGHADAVTTYIAENFGDDYDIKAVESGRLPMTAASIPAKLGERIFAIGVAGGAARPSSGYAFHRIQRQTSGIARAIVEKRAIPTTIASRKYDFFDRVFLEVLAENPALAKDAFLRMFERVPADSLIRFLTEESSIADDLAVISALPKMPFAAAGWRSAGRNFAAQNGRNEKDESAHGALHHPVDQSVVRLVARRAER